MDKLGTREIQTVPGGEPFNRLAAILLMRLEDARPFDAQGDRLAGWKPPLGECHDNVDRWITLHPDACAVRGWLYEGFDGVTYRFYAHSVVRTAGGLVDVTIPSTEPTRPFIEHPREVGGFFALLYRPGSTHPAAHEFRIVCAEASEALDQVRVFTLDDQSGRSVL